MIQLLAPMFEIDYLLPRSFIAALSIDKFESTVCEKKIPTYVVLAGIDNFLKTGIFFKSEKNTTKKMMDNFGFWMNDKTKENMRVKTPIICLYYKYLSKGISSKLNIFNYSLKLPELF